MALINRFFPRKIESNIKSQSVSSSNSCSTNTKRKNQRQTETEIKNNQQNLNQVNSDCDSFRSVVIFWSHKIFDKFSDLDAVTNLDLKLRSDL